MNQPRMLIPATDVLDPHTSALFHHGERVQHVVVFQDLPNSGDVGPSWLYFVAISPPVAGMTYQMVLPTHAILIVVQITRLADESLTSRQFPILWIREDEIFSKIVSVSLRLLCHSPLKDRIIMVDFQCDENSISQTISEE